MPVAAALHDPMARESRVATLRRQAVIALIAFLTLVDLFATQAILPTLAASYGVGPAAMSTAVNASTLGMAASGLGIAVFGHRINRRAGIVTSLALLAVPTALLATAPDLASFAALRIAQGVLMCAAFSLTLAHLGERCGAREAAGAFAAYVTGNVASNLVGRMVSAGVAEQFGLTGNFLFFALLNLAGAALARMALARTPVAPRDHDAGGAGRRPGGVRQHLRHPALRAGFASGFCILFAFIGTFTYVNFRLVGAPFGLSPMALGLVYLVFLPALVTTPLGGLAVGRWGTQRTIRGATAVALLGTALLLATALPIVLAGMALLAAGTFLAQAAATGFVTRAASVNRAAASGLYLASYFAGGLAGTIVLGLAYDALGWTGCVGGIATALLAVLALARALRD